MLQRLGYSVKSWPEPLDKRARPWYSLRTMRNFRPDAPQFRKVSHSRTSNSLRAVPTVSPEFLESLEAREAEALRIKSAPVREGQLTGIYFVRAVLEAEARGTERDNVARSLSLPSAEVLAASIAADKERQAREDAEYLEKTARLEAARARYFANKNAK